MSDKPLVTASSVARIAGNILSGMFARQYGPLRLDPSYEEDFQSAAREALRLARYIAKWAAE